MARFAAQSGDFLGLLTLGSAIDNLSKALPDDTQRSKRGELKKEIERLDRLFENLLQRYRIAMEQYLVLRNENLALRTHVQHLQRALDRASRMNDRLLVAIERKRGR